MAESIRKRLIHVNEEAAIRILGTTNITRVVFPVMFGSTAGPRGGIGGAAMTDHAIEAYYTEDQRAVLFYGPGAIWKRVSNFRSQFIWDE